MSGGVHKLHPIGSMVLLLCGASVVVHWVKRTQRYAIEYKVSQYDKQIEKMNQKNEEIQNKPTITTRE